MPRRMTAREIADELAELIATGELAPGAQLPSYRELAVEYGVGITKISTVILILKERGLVEGAPGQGTFVTGDLGE